MSLRRCKRETTPSQFVRWRVFLHKQANIPTVEHYYLAAIRATIVAALSSKPENIKLEDFILKFVAVRETEMEKHLKLMQDNPELAGPNNMIVGRSIEEVFDALSKLDYKNNPVPKENLSEMQKMKIEMRKAGLKKQLEIDASGKKRTDIEVGADGKITKKSASVIVDGINTHGKPLPPKTPKRKM